MKSNKIGILRIFEWTTLLLFVLGAFGPILMIIISSFKQDKDIFSYVPKLFFKPVFDNYEQLFLERPDFFNALLNSVIVTIGASLVIILLCIPAAYAYSRLYSKKFKLTSFYVILVRMFPPIIVMVPLYPIIRNLALNDTYFILIILYATFEISISTMLLKAFLDDIPKELDEQACIDGCNRFTAFIYIILPALAPGIIAAVVYVSVFAWNDFTFAFLVSGTATKTTPILIMEMQGLVEEGYLNWGTVFSASFIQLIPILIFIFLLQQKLVKGFTLGAVKG